MKDIVLITGGAGFIGSHVADVLFNSGNYNIRILDNLNPKTHNGKWPDYLNSSFELILGDVTSKGDLEKAIDGVDYIIHLAAEMDLNPDFSSFINTNVTSTALIYEIIFKNKLNIKKVVVASTQFVYGEGRWKDSKLNEFFPSSRNNYDLLNSEWDVKCPYTNQDATYLHSNENQIVKPPNHYALSKYFQEQFAIKIGKLYEIPTNCARFSIVHGTRQSLKNTYSGALRTFAYFCHLGLDFSTFEDNLSLRDFVSVYDASNAVKCILEDKNSYEIYNVGSGESFSVFELAQMVSSAFNKKFSFSNKVEFRRGDIRHAISDVSKLKSIGWSLKHSEKDAIAEYVNWFLKQEIDVNRFLETQDIMRKNGQILSK